MEVVDLENGWRMEKFNENRGGAPNESCRAVVAKGCIIAWYDGTNIVVRHRAFRQIGRVIVPASVIMELLEYNALCVEEEGS